MILFKCCLQGKIEIYGNTWDIACMQTLYCQKLGNLKARFVRYWNFIPITWARHCWRPREKPSSNETFQIKTFLWPRMSQPKDRTRDGQSKSILSFQKKFSMSPLDFTTKRFWSKEYRFSKLWWIHSTSSYFENLNNIKIRRLPAKKI